MPFAGLGDGPKMGAAIALKEAADTHKTMLDYNDILQIQVLQLRSVKSNKFYRAPRKMGKLPLTRSLAP